MKKIFLMLFLLIIAIDVFGKNDDFVIKNGTLVKYKGNASYVTVPNDVKKIGKEAFYRNTYIREVKLGWNVEEIEDYAFWCCTSLSKIDLPYSLRYIGSNAFYGCSWLDNVVIPQNMYRIGYCAFSYSGVRTLTIKMNVYDNERSVPSKIKQGFENMQNLKYIYFEFAYNKILVYDTTTQQYYWKK